MKITIKELAFNSKVVLKDIDLTVNEGELICLKIIKRNAIQKNLKNPY